MKILMTHPYYWPYVRRGAERYIHDLSSYLCQRDYQINIVTSKPGRSRTYIKNGVKVHYHHELRHPVLDRLGLKPEISFMPKAFYSLVRGEYDLVHSFFPSDGYAAHLFKKFKRIRYVLNFNGPPIKHVFERAPLLHYLIKKAFESASVIVVNSEFSNRYLKEDYQKDGIVIPGAVDIKNFTVSREKDLDRPKILCTAALGVRYKNIPLLVKAFELFKAKVPKAVLQLSGHVDPHVAKELLYSVDPPIRESVHFLGVGKIENLYRLYAEAAIFVLPSIHEAFGTVLVESLASGTPVVGTDSGGIPEIITDPRIGVLFRPDKVGLLPTNADDLCDAMLQALELAKDAETSHRCREHALRFDWSVVGAQFEEVYKKALSGSGYN